jgi:hypothetical protein
VLKPVVVLLAVVAGFLLWPRGDEQRGDSGPAATATPTPTGTPRPKPPARDRARPLRRPRCREGIPECAATSGRIVFVERVDADGDGDLHVIVSDRRSVSLPGLTAVDVSKERRPRRDPRIGDSASAMGPVQQGRFGQKQIHALVFRVRRR